MRNEIQESFSQFAHNGLRWDRDEMHFPSALTPLAGDYALLIRNAVNDRYSLLGQDFPQRWRCQVIEGYVYGAFSHNVPEPEIAGQTKAWNDACRELSFGTRALWDQKILPELQSIYRFIDELAVDSLSLPELIDCWNKVWLQVTRVWELHFHVIIGPYSVLSQLLTFRDRYLVDVPVDAILSIGRRPDNEMRQVEIDLCDIADIVGSDANLRRLLELENSASDQNYRSAMASSPRLEGLIRSFLEQHGHLGQISDDLIARSWNENHLALMDEVRRRIEAQPRSRDLIGVNEAEMLRWCKMLPDPIVARQFNELITLANEIAPLTEGHNYWIDRMIQSKLKSFVISAAHSLTRSGLIEEPSDIFYVQRHEFGPIAAGNLSVMADVRRRRIRHEQQLSYVPPATLGPRSAAATKVNLFEGGVREQSSNDTLLGVGASRGKVRGPARIVTDQSDFKRIQPGDIFVCVSLNVSWVTILSSSAGLVSSTGGILSHPAVVAREFSLPAVVGVLDATVKIPDGAIIEIDGEIGSVRIIEPGP